MSGESKKSKILRNMGKRNVILAGSKIDHHQIPPETRLKKITSCEMYQKKDMSDARLLIGQLPVHHINFSRR